MTVADLYYISIALLMPATFGAAILLAALSLSKQRDRQPENLKPENL